MKYAVISDVHANLEALNAVLSDIKKNDIKEIFFLGDVVGYGPNPQECIDIIKNESAVQIAGNHDWAMLGLIDINFFNPYAKESIIWALRNTDADRIKILRTFKISQEIQNKDIFLVHSTPKNPEKWSYLLTFNDAYVNFLHFDEKISFIGHTHVPIIVEKKQSDELITYSQRVKISYDSRYIINVGSVGQPRDGDPRACYCVFDDGLIYFRRIEYDITKTQNKMMKYGLPPYLINRLSYGE
ncbi:MAG: metallophosphatase family protein [Thermodesulfovibrionales bacterium]|nr:metallophosphatase family protein [Thermodesulfovibrionales bacterium]